tara:strand:+ start:1974 stop:2195 length:222 start_codon:yes stop_codon:yes gene_type:complete
LKRIGSTYDFGNLSSAAWLGAIAGHARSAIFHLDQLTIFDGSIRFAFQTKTFDSCHVTHALVGGTIDRCFDFK